jgi:hypothetical protein
MRSWCVVRGSDGIWLTGALPVPYRLAPQYVQNAAPGDSGFPQEKQNRISATGSEADEADSGMSAENFVPQNSQTSAPSALSALQAVHCFAMISPFRQSLTNGASRRFPYFQSRLRQRHGPGNNRGPLYRSVVPATKG